MHLPSVKSLFSGKKSIDTKKFELAVENVQEHIIITDSDGIILYANPAVEQTTGFSRKEVVGTKAGALWGKLMDIQFYEKMWDTIKNKKQTFKGVLKNKKKDGREYLADTTLSPVLNEKGDVEFFVGIERDITKEVEVDQAKTEFVSMASHQLRTPLATVKWYAGMLLNGDCGKINKKQAEYLEEIKNGNQKMISLVNALLNVSRIEMGTFSVKPKKVNLKIECEEVLKEFGETIKDKKLKLKTKFQNMPDIQADPSYIRIIFQNLIDNAVKYTPNEGTISIAISIEGEDVLIRVKDTGCGIPGSAKHKIFTKLFRADNVSEEGVGLGLYITKSIIEKAAKGKIWFESKENRGTSFFVSLPITGMEKQEGTKKLI